MVEVEITNYESISHTKLVIDGFTTLIGRNYLGKSSVLRAINAALTNKEGTDFISWGQTFCEVHIKFPDLDILWHKEEGNNFYKINGKDYPKIGKGNPPQVILDAGFRPIILGDKKINLNYAVQFFPLFLVNKRDSKSADILTSVYGLDRIYRAIGLCNKDQKSNSDLLRIREKDLNLVEIGMKKFESFPEIIEKIPDIKSRKAKLEKKEKDIIHIQVWSEDLKNLALQNRKLKPITTVTIPESDKISEDIQEYTELVRYQNNLGIISSSIKKIDPVHKISLPEKSIPEIKESFSEYQKLLLWSSKYRSLSEEVSRLKNIKDVNLPVLSADIEGFEKIEEMSLKFKDMAIVYKECDKELKEITQEIEDIDKELKSFDICPLCGAKRE